MKKLLFISLVLLTSCSSLKDKQINTANKVHSLLYNGKAKELQDLLAVKGLAGRDTERISFEAKIYQKIINKYGAPDLSKCNYIIDRNDFIRPYSIEYPIFTGQDTIMIYKFEKGICLRVLFGPENMNNPSHIADFEILMDNQAYPFNSINHEKQEKILEEIRKSIFNK